MVVSLNSGLESNKEEGEEGPGVRVDRFLDVLDGVVAVQVHHPEREIERERPLLL